MQKIITLIFLIILLLLLTSLETNKEKTKIKAIKTSNHISKIEEEWKPLGKCRITSYCPICNEPKGYTSSSGKKLKYGYAACNWLPNGTKISIEGEIFTIMDTCGTDAIDIFLDTKECTCNLNEYRYVTKQINSQ